MLLLVFGSVPFFYLVPLRIMVLYEVHGSTYIALGIMLLLSWCVVCHHTYHNQSAEHPNDLASIPDPMIMISGSWMVSARSCLTSPRIYRSEYSVLLLPIPAYPFIRGLDPLTGIRYEQDELVVSEVRALWTLEVLVWHPAQDFRRRVKPRWRWLLTAALSKCTVYASTASYPAHSCCFVSSYGLGSLLASGTNSLDLRSGVSGSGPSIWI